MEIIFKNGTDESYIDIIKDDLIRCALEELRKRAEEREELLKEGAW